MQTAESAFGRMGNKEWGYLFVLQLNYIFENILSRTWSFGQDSAMMT